MNLLSENLLVTQIQHAYSHPSHVSPIPVIAFSIRLATSEVKVQALTSQLAASESSVKELQVNRPCRESYFLKSFL